MEYAVHEATADVMVPLITGKRRRKRPRRREPTARQPGLTGDELFAAIDRWAAKHPDNVKVH